MDIRTFRFTDRDKKIWFTSPTVAKYKLTKDGQTHIIAVDVSNLIDGVVYKPSGENIIDLYGVTTAWKGDLEIHRSDRSLTIRKVRKYIDATIPDDPASSDYPVMTKSKQTNPRPKQSCFHPLKRMRSLWQGYPPECCISRGGLEC